MTKSPEDAASARNDFKDPDCASVVFELLEHVRDLAINGGEVETANRIDLILRDNVISHVAKHADSLSLKIGNRGLG